MSQIERYRLIEQTALRGAVTVWRATDAFEAGVEVALEIVALTSGNDEAVADLRRAAHERARREKGVSVRIFEDLERGVVGVATRRAPRPETRLDPERAPPAPSGAPRPLLTTNDAPPETLRDRSSSARWLGGAIVAAILAAVLTLGILVIWRAPWRSASDADEETSTSLLPGHPSHTTSKPRDFTFSGFDRRLRTLRVSPRGTSGPVGEFDGGSCNPPSAPRGFECCIDTDGSRRIFKGACVDRRRSVAPERPSSTEWPAPCHRLPPPRAAREVWMERIERYELIEELHTGGPVTVWRARDTLHEGAEVTLELVAVNAEAVRSLRASAHERSRREKHVTVRIFEDLERARAACDRGSWCPSRVLTREYMGKTDERA